MNKLGNTLRDARIAKGYELEDLQQITKIQKKFLKAIEEGDYDEIPNEFYLHAFIKQYAEAIDLDGDALLVEHGMVEGDEDFVAEDFSAEESDGDLPSRSKKYVDTEQNEIMIVMKKYLPTIALISIILLIIGSLLVAIHRLGSTDEESSSEEVSSSLVSRVETSVESVESKQSAKSEDEDDESDEKLDLEDDQIQVGNKRLTLISDSHDKTTYEIEGDFDDYLFEIDGLGTIWFGVFEDGVLSYDQVIEKGDTAEIEVSPNVEALMLEVGYLEGLELYVNDTLVELDAHLIEFVHPSVKRDRELEGEADESSSELSDVMSEGEGPRSRSRSRSSNNEEPRSSNSEGRYQGPAVLDPNRR